MVNYSTEFPINPGKAVADVLAVATEWILGSPHTKIKSTDFLALRENAIESFSKDTESVSQGYAKNEALEIGGLRYQRVDDGLEWTTTIISHRNIESHTVSIQVECVALKTAASLPSLRKPHLVKQILEKLGGGYDGDIPVTDQPFYFTEAEADVASNIILGNATNRLPIVYVSSSYDGSYVVDPEKLAQWISGIGHVFVEPHSRSFSLQVKKTTSSRNPYDGTVAVFWPSSNARKSYFLDGGISTPAQLQSEIARDIRIALCNRRQISVGTWIHLNEVIARNRYEALKKNGSVELQEFIDAFDSEFEAKELKIEELEGEIARLNAELGKFNQRGDANSAGILRYGEEQNLYSDEIHDIVIEALKHGLNFTHENSRKQHVLQDLIEFNPVTSKKSELAERIKIVFNDYREMDASIRKDLVTLGFELSEEGKHHKAVFRGDGRYTFSISKTSSDFRAGKNLAADINKNLF